MESLIACLPIFFGIGFVLLGRWLYKNPRTLFPSWGFFNPENPRVIKLARLYASFFIFFGTLASIATAGALVFRHVPGMPFLIIVAAIPGAWLLRSKFTPAEQPSDTALDKPENQRLPAKHWKRYLAILVAVAIVPIVIIFAIIADSDVSKMAFAAAEASPTVRQHLGEPIKRGFFTSGSIEISGPSGHADISIPVSGPRGKATIYAVAQKSAGLWKFETLQVAFEDDSVRLNVLAQELASPKP